MIMQFLAAISLTAGFALLGCGRNQENTGLTEFSEIGKTLTECGISGITDELLAQYEKDYADFPEEVELNKTAILLNGLGMGHWNFDTMEWTPSDNGVYSFDVEVMTGNTAYRNFLIGIQSIGGGEIVFSDISVNENDGETDEEVQVSFVCNGVPHTETAKPAEDWFDLRFAGKISRLVDRNGKKLWFTSDGYQSVIIFYRDEAWAKNFEQKTGLKLDSSVE